MIQVGALCYSSVFLFRDDKKKAIMSHPLWQPEVTNPPPIFEIYVGDFNTAGKKSKMLFVSAEKSRKDEVITLIKSIYDGTKKSYPNGAMMLFIPTHDSATSSTELCKKIIFNHEKYLGNETLFCIGGLQDLNTTITLRNNKQVTIHHLLKSLPVMSGMSRSQIFQHAEPNIAAMVTIVTFLAQDYNLVIARQATLETEIRQVLAPREEHKIFVDPDEGIWFGGANKSSKGQLNISMTNTDKASIEYVSHINKIMNSPPKKYTTPALKWGSGMTPADQPTISPYNPNNSHPQQPQPNSNNCSINSTIDQKLDQMKTTTNVYAMHNSTQGSYPLKTEPLI
jgi:hypothetical protein